MSERSTFISQFLVCQGCRAKVNEALLGEHLACPIYAGQVVTIERYPYGEALPCVAGTLGGVYSGADSAMLAEVLESAPAPCHPVLFSVVQDGRGTVTLRWLPDGMVYERWHVEDEAWRVMQGGGHALA